MAHLLRVLAAAVLCWPVLSTAGTTNPTSLGEAIYRNGVLPSGAPIEAHRTAGLRIAGAMAACTNCHRRSGLGMEEGREDIPPIAGSYLFHPRAGVGDDLDLAYVPGMKADRDPYTDATLARAIRTGIGSQGEQLSDVMPRYALDDSQMAALIAYLKTLAPREQRGVSDTALQFATIITPDADPVKRKGVLDVLQKFFVDKNHYVRATVPRHLGATVRLQYKVYRNWQLHVWELTGAPDTWKQQLEAKIAAQPVFAVVSGVGGKTWAPVHEFCEEQALPCLFPNVDLPVVAENDYDNIYLSKGVLLDAELIAHEIKAQRQQAGWRRIVQVFRSADVGKEAAAALATGLPGQGLGFVERGLSSKAGDQELAAAVRSARPGDVLVLWLRPADIAALPPPPAGVSTVFMSGKMGGLEEAPLAAEWRGITHLAYPVDLPEKRLVRVDFALGWFRIRRIPVVAMPEQVDTYLACGIVSDTVNHMADAFVPDYLVERIEGMLEHRVMTEYYPRLTLAPNQRFVSKGGYVVRFAGPTGNKVLPDGDWIVP